MQNSVVTRSLRAAAGMFAVCVLFAPLPVAAQTRPATPTIIEPAFDGRTVNAADVHMETAPFFDEDGDGHLCSDWEIWRASPLERVWRATCATGGHRVHIHLGDGVFEGSHEGRIDLLPESDYRLRVRHRDDSGNPATQYSAYAIREFRTAATDAAPALTLSDITTSPVWIYGVNAAMILPPGGNPPARLVLEGADGRLLLSIRGLDGSRNFVENPPELQGHVQVRVRFDGGSSGLSLPRTSIRITSESGTEHTIYFPEVSVPPGSTRLFWVSLAGSTYVAQSDQQEPVFTELARGSARPFVAMQPGFVIERVATGFQLPVNIAFVPNPGSGPNAILFYVAELYGRIKAVTRSGQVSLYHDGLINFDPTGDFPGSGEQGLAGIVVDPTNGDLYATAVYAGPGGLHYPQVLKLQSQDGGRTASVVTSILRMSNDPISESHQISNITFGPDNHLYVHIGDALVPSDAQNLDSCRGKIIRPSRTGRPIPGNPFLDPSDGLTTRDYIWASGFRNPFGGAWRPSDGQHFIVENGPTVDRLSRLVIGRNYAWDGSDQSMTTFALYNWTPAHAPVNITFVDWPLFGGSGFPADKMGHAFVAESGPTYAEGWQVLGKRIVEFELAQDDSPAAGPITLVEYFGAGRSTIVALATGPDGLYFSELYQDLDAPSAIAPGAKVWRIRYVGGSNLVPAANRSGAGPTDVAGFVAMWRESLIDGTLAGDYDGNGIVEPADVSAFASGWIRAHNSGE